MAEQPIFAIVSMSARPLVVVLLFLTSLLFPKSSLSPPRSAVPFVNLGVSLSAVDSPQTSDVHWLSFPTVIGVGS